MSKKIKHWFPITGLLAILNFGLISTPLQAATYTVCPVGCNYTTISVAITNAVSGDVIFVGPGTYNGNITIDRNIQIVGTGTGSTIIHGDNTASVVTINAGVVVTITGVTIENGAGNITLPASVPTNPTDKSGRRVVELGAGVMLSYEELIGSSLRATGEQVITNVTFRHNSQKISVSLKAAGGYQRAADEIQAFIHRFQPDVPYSPGA